MFTLQDGWIQFGNRPLISVDPQHRIASSGCGTTTFSDADTVQPRMRDRIRLAHYRPASHWVSETAARVVLQGRAAARVSRSDQGLILHLAMENDTCVIRLDGLPWDHNRIVFHIAQPAGETVRGGFSLLGDDGRGPVGEAWNAGIHYIWASRGHMHPVSGYVTSGGFWLRSESPALAGFHMMDGKTDVNSLSDNRIAVWDAKATLRLGLQSDETAARKRLFLLPADAYPDFAKLSGGGDACEKKAMGLAAEGRHPLLFIEDWQGMRRTLLSTTSGCTWRPDPEQYHRLPDLIGRLQDRGFPCALNFLPYLNMDSELFREAAVRGYCLTAGNGRVYEDKVRENPVAWIDLTQPKAIGWIQERMRELKEQIGFDAVVSEVDMAFPAKASAAGGTIAQLRNRWASMWLETCQGAFAGSPGILAVPGEWVSSFDVKAVSTKSGRSS